MTSGAAAELVSAVPGAEVHELPCGGLPSDGAAAIVPIALPLTAPTISTGIAGDNTIGWLVLELAEAPVFAGVTLITDGESTTAVAEQFTLVPGIVGSCASGGEAKVVAGAPGMAAAEKRLVNGLGPPKGDDTIAPGVVGIPSAVVPTVDICAMQQLLLSKATIIAQKIRMSNFLRRKSHSAFMNSWARAAVLLSPHSPGPPLD
jgi:hypothetical protein